MQNSTVQINSSADTAAFEFSDVLRPLTGGKAIIDFAAEEAAAAAQRRESERQQLADQERERQRQRSKSLLRDEANKHSLLLEIDELLVEL